MKPKPKGPFVRTQSEVKAQARILTGQQSRVALAATDDTTDTSTELGTTGELWLYGLVGGWWRGFDAESVSNALRGMDVETLFVRIHSPGGNAGDGVAIANLFRNHSAHVVGIVDGMAASAASVIAIGCDELVMCPGSQLMLHDASAGAYGNAADMREVADWLDGQSANYAGVYAYKAGGTPEQWRQVMVANNGWGTYYTAEQAVAAGLGDSVGTRPAIGSPPVAPEDELDDDELWARAAHDLELLEQAIHPAARAAWCGEQPPKPPSASAVGSPKKEGATLVDFDDEQIATLRKQVGFPEDADAATITAALKEALEERAEAPKAELTEKTVPKGMKLVSETIFDDVTAKADRGATAAEELLNMQCKATLDRYKDRFPATPEARAKWEADYRRDPAGTEKYLAASAVLVPTAENGHGGDGEDKPVAVTEDPNYQKWSF